MENFSIFALNSSRDFGKKVAGKLGFELSLHEERDFEDGEHKARPLENVRNKNVYVIQSLYQDAKLSVNDKLCRLLFFIGALHDASALRITAIVPYLCYSRKDRKTKPRDPVTTRYIARLFEAAGADHIVTMDVHNLQAYQNAFRCHQDHLVARGLFADYFAELLQDESITVMSPDVGGIKRAEKFRQLLSDKGCKDCSLSFMEKQRSQDIISGEAVVGDVKHTTVIIFDDLISTGTTLARSARACHKLGARKIYAVATHGLFIGNVAENLFSAPLEKVVVTDTIPAFRIKEPISGNKVEVLDTSSLWAEAIDCIESGSSIVKLMGEE